MWQTIEARHSSAICGQVKMRAQSPYRLSFFFLNVEQPELSCEISKKIIGRHYAGPPKPSWGPSVALGSRFPTRFCFTVYKPSSHPLPSFAWISNAVLPPLHRWISWDQELHNDWILETLKIQPVPLCCPGQASRNLSLHTSSRTREFTPVTTPQIIFKQF